ncbi:hypothetical protein HMPREF9123_1171 [Neisseria bacilliformis ATCC BAA-1200]|uniref:Ribbon-helix-helix protein CopG domain-containing protein n=1 Tax=Neisseria bacilliformis ATCC BAA-1200 TaxID=888742 RepID=F2BBR6_9NEIS|nr:hypothetical protein [Neisseria bacilliformis]EGF11082.1 hypothetical protein HMPREF9123_1171 [Neisseria bacilliformis ATCC BAA-1200]QMT48243.1 ribbon-helix-helix protein, CopG family [Neisseria bacilliformis]
MQAKKYDQAAYNRKSREKLGLKAKTFTLDADTVALFEQLSAQTNLPQVQVLKNALACYADKLGGAQI